MSQPPFESPGDVVISPLAVTQDQPLVVVNQPAPPRLGKLPALFVESKSRQILFAFLAIALVVGYFLALHVYWFPAHPGTDQNGYLVGGKFLATTATSGFKPADPYMFVGRMWVETDNGWYFPKYPVGLSLIYAIAWIIGGAKSAVTLCYLISPMMMSLALIAAYFLLRLAVGSFAAILGVLVLMTSAVTLGLTNNPNSHATAICLVTCGMYFLIRWWQRNGIYRAVIAGLLLGSAVTIRYTEGLLLLPLLIVVVLNLRMKTRRSLIESGLLLASWFLPVSLLIAYNWFSFHHLTGYDPTNESTGFSWENFQNNWEVMLRQIYSTGLFFLLPFSILGLVMMWRWNWRFALVITAWTVPNLALYSAYYWAPDGTSIAYLRFFLTIFPALILAAVWAFNRIIHLAAIEGSRTMPTVALGIVLCIASGVSLFGALPELETDAQQNQLLAIAAQAVSKACPAGSVVFGFVPDRLLNHIQFTSDYQLYDGQQFSKVGMQRLANIDPNQPNGLQPQRAKEMYDRISRMSDAELLKAQNGLMTDAFANKNHVYMIVNKANLSAATRFLPRRSFTTEVVGSWDTPPDPRPVRRARAGLAFIPRLFANTDQTKPTEFQILEVKQLPTPKPKSPK